MHSDGVADDTEALQAAINTAQETGGEGIVFLPSGRYRLTTTVSVWGGIRTIGYGEKRPVLVLAANTSGYTDAAQIYVYDLTGKEIDRLDVPERPIDLAFGGSDRRTLFIAARTSLYSVRTKNAGR